MRYLSLSSLRNDGKEARQMATLSENAHKMTLLQKIYVAQPTMVPEE